MQWKYLILIAGFLAFGATFAPQALFGAPRDNTWRGDTRTTVSVIIENSVSLDESLLREMDRELRRIFKPSDTAVEIVMPQDRDAHAVFDTEVIVMRVVGRCQLDSMAPPNGHKADALGRTFVTDGTILPFVELNCKQISGALRARLSGVPAESRLAALGRAMSRVLAHEIYHVLAQTSAHSSHGIAADAMSAHEMVCDHLDFRYEDFESMGLVPTMGTH